MGKYSISQSPRNRAAGASKSSGNLSSSAIASGWLSKLRTGASNALGALKASVITADSKDIKENNISCAGSAGSNYHAGGETPALVRRGRTLMQKLEERERLNTGAQTSSARVLRSALKSSKPIFPTTKYSNSISTCSLSSSSASSDNKDEGSTQGGGGGSGVMEAISSVAPYVYMEVVSKWNNFSLFGKAKAQNSPSSSKGSITGNLFGNVLDWFGTGLDDKNNACSSESRSANSPYHLAPQQVNLSRHSHSFSNGSGQQSHVNLFPLATSSSSSMPFRADYPQQNDSLVRPLPADASQPTYRSNNYNSNISSNFNSHNNPQGGSTFQVPFGHMNKQNSFNSYNALNSNNNNNNNNNNSSSSSSSNNYNRDDDNLSSDVDELLNMSTTTATNTAMNGMRRGASNNRRSSKSRLSIGTSEFIHDIVGQDGPDINLFPTKLQFSAKKGDFSGIGGGGGIDCHLHPSRHVKWGQNEVLEISGRNNMTGAANSMGGPLYSNSNSNPSVAGMGVGGGRFDSLDTQSGFRPNSFNNNINNNSTTFSSNSFNSQYTSAPSTATSFSSSSSSSSLGVSGTSSFESKGPITLSSVKRRLASKPAVGAVNGHPIGVSNLSSAGISNPNTSANITLSSIKRRYNLNKTNNITSAPINRTATGNLSASGSQPDIEVDIYSNRGPRIGGGLSSQLPTHVDNKMHNNLSSSSASSSSLNNISSSSSRIQGIGNNGMHASSIPRSVPTGVIRANPYGANNNENNAGSSNYGNSTYVSDFGMKSGSTTSINLNNNLRERNANTQNRINEYDKQLRATHNNNF